MDTQQLKYDAIIIGAGPAGFTAGIYLGRFLLKTLILETTVVDPLIYNKKAARSLMPGIYHNVPGYPQGIERHELKSSGIQQAQELGCDYQSKQVLSIERQSEFFEVLCENASYTGKNIILAMGIQDAWSDLPNLDHYVGQSLFWSVEVNGMEAKDHPAGIVGSDDTAFEEAIRLCVYSPKVYLLTNGEVLRLSEDMQECETNFSVEVIEDPIQAVTGDKGTIQKILFEGGHEIEINTLFSPPCYQYTANLLAHRLGVQMDEQGFIRVNHQYETSMPQVYAIGDIANTPHKQVISAMYQGMEAAWNINNKHFKEMLQETSKEMSACL